MWWYIIFAIAMLIFTTAVSGISDMKELVATIIIAMFWIITLPIVIGLMIHEKNKGGTD